MQYTDMLILTEIKFEDTFLVSGFFSTVQFSGSGFSEPYRIDRSWNGEGVLIYICENILIKLLDEHVGWTKFWIM